MVPNAEIKQRWYQKLFRRKRKSYIEEIEEKLILMQEASQIVPSNGVYVEELDEKDSSNLDLYPRESEIEETTESEEVVTI